MKDLQETIESLSPLERKIIPYLKSDVEEIIKKSELDRISVLRALKFLENKGILKVESKEDQIIDLGVNGIYYKKQQLPERKLISVLENSKNLSFEEAKKISKLSENEFKVSLGVLKGKAFITLNNGKIVLIASKSDISKKMLEEKFLEVLPIEERRLSPEQMHAYLSLKKRKDIIEVKSEKIISFTLSQLGEKLAGLQVTVDLIEEVTPELIKSAVKGKKFRIYDISAPVPRIYGGKRHFVNQAISYGRRIWLDLGFKEMNGAFVESSFWNFDALFTPQDHPARDMQDTFFIKNLRGKISNRDIVENVKKAHEKGIKGSKGWEYTWNEGEAEHMILRTHTTNLTARTLALLKPSDLPAKYFSIGKVFRNETLDWIHGFEFYQTEGIVVDENANFQHLLWYLKEFYKKMGFEKIRFRPGFFPYTEPSVEFEVYDEKKEKWIELGGAGMLRPEVVFPLLGKDIPVLAWGQGFDRIIKDVYKIKDLREMYSNDLNTLRARGVWKK